MRWVGLVVVALAMTGGCKSSNPMEDDDDEPPHDGSDGPPTEHLDIPVTVNRDLDLLFVVDDSPGMDDKQKNLAAALPNLVNVLNTVPGGLPNLHVGVVTTDLGTTSQADPPAPPIGNGPSSCSGQGKGGLLQLGTVDTVDNAQFLTSLRIDDGTRQANFNGTLEDALATMVERGGAGCGFEQPLAAMVKGISATVNPGFRRPDAHLAVIVLTDEDDCSAEHANLFGADGSELGALESFRCTHFGVTCSGGGATADDMDTVGVKTGCASAANEDVLAKATDFVSKLTDEDDGAVVAVIAGTPDPFQIELRAPSGGGSARPALAHSCAYTDGLGTLETGDPAVRLKEFVDALGNGSVLGTVCQIDLADQLALAGAAIRSKIGTNCFEQQLADVDPNTPGTQFACTAFTQEPGGAKTPFDECDATQSNPPCWHIEEDSADCPSAEHLAFELAGDLPPDAHVIVDCQVAE